MSYVNRAPPGVYGVKPAITPMRLGKVPIKMKMLEQTPVGMGITTAPAKHVPPIHKSKRPRI